MDSVRFSVFTLRVREDGELILHVVYSRRVDADIHARGQNVFVRVEVVQRVIIRRAGGDLFHQRADDSRE